MKLYPDKENQSSRNVGIVASLYDEPYFYLLKYDIDKNLNELVMNLRRREVSFFQYRNT